MPSSARFLFALSLSVFCFATSAHAEQGVSADKIVIGISTNLTGPSSNRAKEIKVAMDTVFERVNRAGGINGRKLTTIVYDDAYLPEKAVQNAKKLLDQDKAFVLYGFFGAAVSKAMLPFVAATGVPFLFPSSGSTAIRRPVVKNIFNVRPGYDTETRTLVNYLVKERGFKDIAVLNQDDSLGQEGRSGVQKALAALELTLKVAGSYSKTTGDIAPAFEQIQAKSPQAVIVCGMSEPAAALAKRARLEHKNWVIAATTPVGGSELLRKGGADVEEMILSQSFPSPEANLALNKQMKADAVATGRKVEDLNVEGYANALVFVEGLKRAGKDLTRASLVSALESLGQFEIGGLKMFFGPESHEALDSAFLLVVRGGKYVDMPK